MATIAEMLALALQDQQAGQFAGAEQLCRQILQVEPAHADTLNLLGVVGYQTGRHEEAVQYLRQAIAAEPTRAAFHANLALAHHALGRLEEAIAGYQQALQFQPDEAIVRYNLGLAYCAQGERDKAAGSFQHALRLQPNNSEAHNNLGILLREQGRPEEATACFQRAIDLRPDNAEAHFNMGIARQAQGQLDEAVTSYLQGLRLIPEQALAHYNLGIIYTMQNRFTEAESCFRNAVRLKPDYAEGHNNLSYVLWVQGRLEEALACAQQALRLRSDSPETRCSLGVVLMELGRLDEALASFEQALQLQPQCIAAHYHRGAIQLLRGNFAEGLPECEWRAKVIKSRLRSSSPPSWDGSSLTGRTILLHQEGGLGDVLHFIRYAPLLKEHGGRVLVTCAKSLIPLLSSCAGIDELVPLGSALPPHDVCAFMQSLPFLFRTVLATIPADVPYLHADAGLVEHWRRQLSPIKAFRIGIVWQGSLGSGTRSVSLEHFAPLGRIAGVRLFSLQKGPGREQLRERADRSDIVDLGPRLDETTGAFMDTVAVIKNLDLVITIDTAVGHLAGALGVPVWGAHWSTPHWRWLLEREDSPWYPTMRLFRQKKPGEWDDVFQRIAAEVNRRVSGCRVEG